MDSSLKKGISTFGSRLLHWRYQLLVLVLIISAIAWPISRRLEFDQSIESLYAENDPHLLTYQKSKQLFGGDEVAIVAWHVPHLFEENRSRVLDEQARNIREFSKELSAIEGINAQSTQNIADALRQPINREEVRELMEKILVSEDGKTSAIILRFLPEKEAKVPRGETIARIRKLASAHDPPAYVVGEPIQIHDMFRYVEEDGTTLFLVHYSFWELYFSFSFKIFAG